MEWFLFYRSHQKLPKIVVNYPLMSGNTQNIGYYLKLQVYLKYRAIPDISVYPLLDDISNCSGSGIG